MKNIIIFLMLISISIFPRTRKEAKEGIKDFVKQKTSTSSNEDNKYFNEDKDKDKDKDKKDKEDDDEEDYGGSIIGAIFGGLLEAIFGGVSSNNRKAKKNDPFSKLDKDVVWQDSFLLYSKDFFAYDNKLKMFYFTASYNYQYIKPTGINNTTIETPWLNIAKIESSLFFNLIYLNYERSSKYSSNLFKSRKLLGINNSENHSWERFSAKLILSDLFGKVYIAYDKQIFISTLISSDKKYYNSIKINKGNSITSTNLFREFNFGTYFDKHKFTKIDLGFFYLNYNKPHSLITDRSYIYDTYFKILGSYFDLIVNYKFIHFRTLFKIGDGNSEMNNYSSNIMYFQFNGDIGLYYNITDFLKIELLAKTEYRGFYFSDFNLSDDFIFTANAGLTLSF